MVEVSTTIPPASASSLPTNSLKSVDDKARCIRSLRDCPCGRGFLVGAFYLSLIVALSWLKSSEYLMKNLALCSNLSM